MPDDALPDSLRPSASLAKLDLYVAPYESRKSQARRVSSSGFSGSGGPSPSNSGLYDEFGAVGGASGSRRRESFPAPGDQAHGRASSSSVSQGYVRPSGSLAEDMSRLSVRTSASVGSSGFSQRPLPLTAGPGSALSPSLSFGSKPAFYEPSYPTYPTPTPAPFAPPMNSYTPAPQHQNPGEYAPGLYPPNSNSTPSYLQSPTTPTPSSFMPQATGSGFAPPGQADYQYQQQQQQQRSNFSVNSASTGLSVSSSFGHTRPQSISDPHNPFYNTTSTPIPVPQGNALQQNFAQFQANHPHLAPQLPQTPNPPMNDQFSSSGSSSSMSSLSAPQGPYTPPHTQTLVQPQNGAYATPPGSQNYHGPGGASPHSAGYQTPSPLPPPQHQLHHSNSLPSTSGGYQNDYYNQPQQQQPPIPAPQFPQPNNQPPPAQTSYSNPNNGYNGGYDGNQNGGNQYPAIPQAPAHQNLPPIPHQQQPFLQQTQQQGYVQSPPEGMHQALSPQYDNYVNGGGSSFTSSSSTSSMHSQGVGHGPRASLSSGGRPLPDPQQRLSNGHAYSAPAAAPVQHQTYTQQIGQTPPSNLSNFNRGASASNSSLSSSLSAPLTNTPPRHNAITPPPPPPPLHSLPPPTNATNNHGQPISAYEQLNAMNGGNLPPPPPPLPPSASVSPSHSYNTPPPSHSQVSMTRTASNGGIIPPPPPPPLPTTPPHHQPQPPPQQYSYGAPGNYNQNSGAPSMPFSPPPPPPPLTGSYYQQPQQQWSS